MKIPKQRNSDGTFKKGENMGSNHSKWKGDDASYYAIHIWLKNNYGKANKCENPSCEKKSKRFEWALLKNKIHSHNRKNYWMLCKSCHTRYDEINIGNKSYMCPPIFNLFGICIFLMDIFYFYT